MLSEKHLDQFCQICYGNYELGEDEGIRPNGICYNCWYNHVKTSLTKITYKLGSTIISPFEGSPNISATSAINSLKPPHMTELEEWLFKKYTTFTTDINKCPSQTCDFVYIHEHCRLGPRANYNCPKCLVPLMANTAFSFRSIFGSLYFLIFAGMCPKCDIPIEKISGCPHMTCPCGHQFCWYCSKDHRHTHNNVYNLHTVKECAMILLTKFILVICCVLGLILTISGHEGFKKFTTFLSWIFSMVFRIVFVDLVLGIQVYFYSILKMRRINAFQNSNQTTNYLIVVAIINVLILIGLYYLEQLALVLSLITTELLIGGIIIGIISLAMHSIDTWFIYIQ